jgi:hypothetical protein
MLMKITIGFRRMITPTMPTQNMKTARPIYAIRGVPWVGMV